MFEELITETRTFTEKVLNHNDNQWNLISSRYPYTYAFDLVREYPNYFLTQEELDELLDGEQWLSRSKVSSWVNRKIKNAGFNLTNKEFSFVKRTICNILADAYIKKHNINISNISLSDFIEMKFPPNVDEYNVGDRVLYITPTNGIPTYGTISKVKENNFFCIDGKDHLFNVHINLICGK